MSDIIQLIYSSTPFGYDTADLNGILLDARRRNRLCGITGALICRHDVFMQLLEGPSESVADTYRRIFHDDRHVEVALRFKGHPRKRLFDGWSMLHDPAYSVIWSIEEVADGALERASEQDFLQAFAKLSARM